MPEPVLPVEPDQPVPTRTAEPQPIHGQTSGLASKRSYKKPIVWTAVGLLGAFIGVLVVGLIWYNLQLLPRSDDTQERVLVVIESGASPTQISEQLEDKGIIRSSTAFDVYVRLSGVRDKLLAGSYRLAPADDLPTIVGHITKGSVDTFNLTLFPGSTLVDSTNRPVASKLDVTTVLRKAGYSDNEISAALSKTYNHPVFATKPASADIEGYVYGETYNFNSGASVEDILIRTFDELYSVVQENDLIAQYEARGLTLYQGITLASIVQREVSTEQDRKSVAAVFYNRLAAGMTLGSDVTFIYAANKLGIEPISTLQSPYNTRINPGLPPGPIAAPGLSSLMAVAAPTSNDFLFFVAGDDGTTYFARTNAEHEQNVARYCTVECAKP